MEPYPARTLLIAQFCAERAARYADDNGNEYVMGHRAWLSNIADKRIGLPAKLCAINMATGVRELLVITIAIL